MPAIKAKTIRLIDILGTINEQETVLLTFNHGRSSCSNTALMIESRFKKELSTPVIAITCKGGIINIFI